jgi:hypothetical protein
MALKQSVHYDNVVTNSSNFEEAFALFAGEKLTAAECWPFFSPLSVCAEQSPIRD